MTNDQIPIGIYKHLRTNWRMRKFNFEIKCNDKRSGARCGVIHTAHGDIQTPSFVPVGTQATVKSLSNQDLEEIGSQVFFINTYHQYLRPGLAVIKKFGGLHNFSGWQGPLMTDSAGFQIFSLGDINRRRRLCLQGDTLQVPLVRISEEGVTFRSHLDGSEHFFTPEKSMEIQSILSADIMIAFDECTYYPASHDYAENAMQRTHRWAGRSLNENSKFKIPRKNFFEIQRGRQNSKFGRNEQVLYGVIQGGVFEDLRKQSAAFISSLPFEGIAIGGVAVGESKKEMIDVLDWTIPFLPEEKPRHLLGVGEIDDIFELVERGIDSFDCVMPTRLGRMGFCLTKLKVKSSKLKVMEKFILDLTKSEFAMESTPIDEGCECFVCKNYNRAYLHHLFRAKELSIYRLLTFHNLWFVEKLLSEIRQSIVLGNFRKLKKQWLGN